MLIHELSKVAGISIHTIRFYEKSGLIKGKRKPEVKSNNYFHYDEETIARLALINEAKSIGFSLSEISNILDAWFKNQYSLKKKLFILDEKMVSIDAKIKQLRMMKKKVSDFKKSIQDENC